MLLQRATTAGALLVLTALAHLPGATLLELRAPLTTVHSLVAPQGGTRLVLDCTVPADAPADLGIGAFRTDRDGVWYQRLRDGVLPPGRHQLVVDLGAQSRLVAEPGRGLWIPPVAARAYRAGVFFWSATASRAQLTIHRLELTQAPPAEPAVATPSLRDLAIADLGPDGVRLRTGKRWSLHCRPHPWPDNPFDPDRFHLELVVTDERAVERRLGGFYRQPLDLLDAGDHEAARATAPAHMAVRWRPRVPGRYRARLEARWNGGEPLVVPLPDLVVQGPIWDDYVRVDSADPRFFATGRATGTAAFYWPTAINLRSVNDPRGSKRTGSRLSPDRRLHSYAAYLQRFGAAGTGLAEVWLSNWNLALEWREDWPGYGGIGCYNQINAERIDHLLDQAWAAGMRINLVVRNHGQASERTDAEWPDNPWNARLRASRSDGRGDARPGPIRDAADFFTDPAALAGQERLRRYLIARYADHPAVFGWKLWTEQNLTAGRNQDRYAWHRAAAARWTELDPYQHPVTSHWSGDYRVPDRRQVALPMLDYICIDAYHGRSDSPQQSLVDLFWDGMHGRAGLARFAKPIVITEFGGSHVACPEPQLQAEFAAAPWLAMVSGYGTGPMLWWFEWVDQNDQWAPMGAINAFLAGEDLRHAGRTEANRTGPCSLAAHSSAGALWGGGWFRHGHLLGYLIDRQWIWDGDRSNAHQTATLVVGDRVVPGRVQIEWWDADNGQRLTNTVLRHGGGRLEITVPAFTGHIAFKLRRLPDASDPDSPL